MKYWILVVVLVVVLVAAAVAAAVGWQWCDCQIQNSEVAIQAAANKSLKLVDKVNTRWQHVTVSDRSVSAEASYRNCRLYRYPFTYLVSISRLSDKIQPNLACILEDTRGSISWNLVLNCAVLWTPAAFECRKCTAWVSFLLAWKICHVPPSPIKITLVYCVFHV